MVKFYKLNDTIYTDNKDYNNNNYTNFQSSLISSDL